MGDEGMLKSELKSQEYRLRAEQALAAAGRADLDQIRQRHLQAAATWSELAEREDVQAQRSRLMLEAQAAKLAAAAPPKP